MQAPAHARRDMPYASVTYMEKTRRARERETFTDVALVFSAFIAGFLQIILCGAALYLALSGMNITQPSHFTLALTIGALSAIGAFWYGFFWYADAEFDSRGAPVRRCTFPPRLRNVYKTALSIIVVTNVVSFIFLMLDVPMWQQVQKLILGYGIFLTLNMVAVPTVLYLWFYLTMAQGVLWKVKQ